MDVITAIHTEQAANDFKDVMISDDLIREVVDAGITVRDNDHSQAWQFVVIRDRDILRALSECFRFAGHMSDSSFAVALVADQEDLFLKGQIVAYMQLAAWDLGLGSCLAPVMNPARVKMILGIPPHMIFNTAISFGLLAKQPGGPALAREKRQDEAIRWERW